MADSAPPVAPEKAIVTLLGPPRIERGGQPVAVDTRKAIALVAYLALSGRVQSRDHLAALLWPEAGQSRARSALRRTLSTLNSAIDGVGLEIERESLALRPEDIDIDVNRFRNKCASDDLASLREAAEIFGGEFLAGFGLRDSPEFDEWQLAVADDLRRELGDVLDRLSTALGDSDPQSAIAYAKRWVSLDDLHEPAHRALMQLYARLGDRASALRQYRECVAALERDLGVEPLDETTELYESIREDRTPHPVIVTRPIAESTVELPLVGRDGEMRALVDAYDTMATHGHLSVIGGEPGIGKTRLVHEFTAAVRSRGAFVLEARCHPEEERMAYGTIVELLRAIPVDRRAECDLAALVEASQLVRELAPDATPLPALDSPAARRRLFEGVSDVIVQATSSSLPAVVFADDVHWMDESSRDVFGFIVRRLYGRRLCVVLTWRTEEVPPAHPLRRMLADAHRQGVSTAITLQRLTQDDVAELARRADAPVDVASSLFAETAGVPFFLSEYLKGGTEDLPAGVRDLLESRVTTVSRGASQILTAAGVIGRAFEPRLVREASGRSESEVVAGLDELTAHGLIEENDDHYDFTHPKLREYVYENTTLGRRRLLHGRVAKATARAIRRRPELAVVAAHHFERAGLEDAAAEHFRTAGDHAKGIYANAEALSHYRSALALGHADTAGLHEAVGDLFMLGGQYAHATASFEKAAALGADLAAVARKLGEVRHRLGDWDLAEAHYLEAERSMERSSERARVIAERSLNAHRAGRADVARALAARSLEEAEADGNERASAQAHNVAGILASHDGDLEGARRHLEASLALAERLDDPAVTAAALNNLSLALRMSGALEDALAHAERALELCRRVGDRHREAAVHSNIADVLHELGRPDDAMEHLKASAAIFSDVGEAGEPQPEIWKLVEW